MDSGCLRIRSFTTHGSVGVEIDRDARGARSEVLRRLAQSLVRHMIARDTVIVVKHALVAAVKQFTSMGITSVPEDGISSSDQLTAYQELRASGDLPVPTYPMKMIDSTLEPLAKLGGDSSHVGRCTDVVSARCDDCRGATHVHVARSDRPVREEAERDDQSRKLVDVLIVDQDPPAIDAAYRIRFEPISRRSAARTSSSGDLRYNGTVERGAHFAPLNELEGAKNALDSFSWSLGIRVNRRVARSTGRSIPHR